MGVSYNKLKKLLVDKDMTMSELRKQAEIAPNTMTKINRNENVNMEILEKICMTLDCDFGDIMEYIKD